LQTTFVTIASIRVLRRGGRVSIAATTTYAELKKGQARKPVGTNADEGAVKKELGRITAFVPTEVVSTYVAILGITTPNSHVWRWVLLLVIALLAVFLCWYFWKTASIGLPAKALTWSIVFALVGLAAWAAALPSSPFFSFDGYSTTIGGIAVLIAAPVIPRLATLVGVAPPKE
jgi:hypothetical protein